MGVVRAVWRGDAWYVIRGTSNDPIVPPPAPNPNDAARNALPDDGSYEVFAGVNCGLMPSTPESSLTVVAGNQTFSDTSSILKVITGKKFTGNVTVSGKNYTFKNCLFNGPGGPGQSLVTAWAVTVANLTLEDCEIRISTPTNTAVGFYGWNSTLRRVWIHNTEDGFRPHRLDMLDASNAGKAVDLNFRMYGSYVSDLLYHSPDQPVGGTQPDHQTHTDGMQVFGGGNVVLRGNTILGKHNMALGDASTPPTPLNANGTPVTGSGHISGNIAYPSDTSISCMMFSVSGQALFGSWTIDRNRIGGGSVIINMVGAPMAAGSLIQITNNIVVKEPVNPVFVLRKIAYDSQIFMSGNTHADGTPWNTETNA